MLSPRGPEPIDFETYMDGRDYLLPPSAVLDDEGYTVRLKSKRPEKNKFAFELPSKVVQIEHLADYSIARFVVLVSGGEFPHKFGMARDGILFNLNPPLPENFEEIDFGTESGYFSGALDLFGN